MSTDWLSSRDAIDLVADRNGSVGASSAIAKRANAGLIRSRARLLVREVPAPQLLSTLPKDVDQLFAEMSSLKMSSSSKSTVEAAWAAVPKVFWWAEGGAALDQDWTAGDFSTWLDRTYAWKAFGVEFDRNGIEALAPKVADCNFCEESDCFASEASSDLLAEGPMPSDNEIGEKLRELLELGLSRDSAVKFIRQVSGFEKVGNEHARRVVAGELPRGRPKKLAPKSAGK